MKINKLLSIMLFILCGSLILISGAEAAPDSVTKDIITNIINNAKISLTNVTGTSSTQCSNGQVLTNVTLSNGAISSICVNQTVAGIDCSAVTSSTSPLDLCTLMNLFNYSFEDDSLVVRDVGIVPDGQFGLGTDITPWYALYVRGNINIGESSGGNGNFISIASPVDGTTTNYSIHLPSNRPSPDENTYWVLTNGGDTGIWQPIPTVTTTLPASNITGFGLENLSASCSTVGCTATQTCSAGKSIMWGLSSTALTTCAGNPSNCNGYCQAGATSCSATAAVSTASVVIYCGVFN
jgi:hypothetical protein